MVSLGRKVGGEFSNLYCRHTGNPFVDEATSPANANLKTLAFRDFYMMMHDLAIASPYTNHSEFRLLYTDSSNIQVVGPELLIIPPEIESNSNPDPNSPDASSRSLTAFSDCFQVTFMLEDSIVPTDGSAPNAYNNEDLDPNNPASDVNSATFTVYEDDFKDEGGAKLTLRVTVTKKEVAGTSDSLSGATCQDISALNLDYDLTPFSDPRGRLLLANKNGGFDAQCSREMLY